MEIHTRQKICHFDRYVANANLFWLKSFVRSSGWSVHMGEFSSRLPRFGRKNRDRGNRASPTSHMNTSKPLRRQEWGSEISETEPAQITGLIWRGLKHILCQFDNELMRSCLTSDTKIGSVSHSYTCSTGKVLLHGWKWDISLEDYLGKRVLKVFFC